MGQQDLPAPLSELQNAFAGFLADEPYIVDLFPIYSGAEEFRQLDWLSITKDEELDKYTDIIPYLPPKTYCFVLPKLLRLLSIRGRDLGSAFSIDVFLSRPIPFRERKPSHYLLEPLNKRQSLAVYNAIRFICKNDSARCDQPKFPFDTELNEFVEELYLQRGKAFGLQMHWSVYTFD